MLCTKQQFKLKADDTENSTKDFIDVKQNFL